MRQAINVSGEVHGRFKDACRSRGLMVGIQAEKALELYRQTVLEQATLPAPAPVRQGKDSNGHARSRR